MLVLGGKTVGVGGVAEKWFSTFKGVLGKLKVLRFVLQITPSRNLRLLPSLFFLIDNGLMT